MLFEVKLGVSISSRPFIKQIAWVLNHNVSNNMTEFIVTAGVMKYKTLDLLDLFFKRGIIPGYK